MEIIKRKSDNVVTHAGQFELTETGMTGTTINGKRIASQVNTTTHEKITVDDVPEDFIGGRYVYPWAYAGGAPSQDAIADVENRIVQKLKIVVTAGVNATIDGQQVRLATHHDARQEIRELVGFLERNGGTQKLTTRSRHRINADLTIAQNMLAAVEQYVTAAFARESDLVDQIRSATSYADVQQVLNDLDTGWPS